jgi:hypothetical protein
MRRDAQIEGNRAQLVVGTPINSIHGSKLNRARALVIEEFWLTAIGIHKGDAAFLRGAPPNTRA